MKRPKEHFLWSFQTLNLQCTDSDSVQPQPCHDCLSPSGGGEGVESIKPIYFKPSIAPKSLPPMCHLGTLSAARFKTALDHDRREILASDMMCLFANPPRHVHLVRYLADDHVLQTASLCLIGVWQCMVRRGSSWRRGCGVIFCSSVLAGR